MTQVITEGRKSSGFWGDSTVLRTIVSGGLRALKPVGGREGGEEREREREGERGKRERGREVRRREREGEKVRGWKVRECVKGRERERGREGRR